MTTAIVPKELLTATTGGLSLLVISGGADGQVLTQQADGTYAPEAVSAGIGGSVGSTDNRLVRSDGTGGSTVQATGITVDDSNNVSGIGTLSTAAITASGVITAPVGSVSTPSVCFSGDENTGVYWVSADSIAIATGGVQRMVISSGGITTFSGSVLTGGHVVLPVNSGIYWTMRTYISTPADGQLRITNLAESAGILFDATTDGTCKLRTKSDSGDGSLTCASITASALMCCGVYTFATVPSASSNTGKFLRISDRAQKHAYSDGTNWRFFGDDAIIS